MDGVLGGDVAGRSLDEGTATQSPGGRIEGPDPGLVTGVHVCQAETPCVVQMKGDEQLGYFSADRTDQSFDGHGVGHARGVGQVHFCCPGVGKRFGSFEYVGFIDSSLVDTPEGTLQPGPNGQTGVGGKTDQSRHGDEGIPG